MLLWLLQRKISELSKTGKGRRVVVVDWFLFFSFLWAATQGQGAQIPRRLAVRAVLSLFGTWGNNASSAPDNVVTLGNVTLGCNIDFSSYLWLSSNFTHGALSKTGTVSVGLFLRNFHLSFPYSHAAATTKCCFPLNAFSVVYFHYWLALICLANVACSPSCWNSFCWPLTS